MVPDDSSSQIRTLLFIILFSIKNDISRDIRDFVNVIIS